MLHKLSLYANSMAKMPYPIDKYRITCLQIDFHLVSEYCQTAAPLM